MIVSTSSPSRRLPCSQMSRMTRWGFRSSMARKRFVAVAGKACAVTLVLQNAGDKIADIGLVVDDQNVS